MKKWPPLVVFLFIAGLVLHLFAGSKSAFDKLVGNLLAHDVPELHVGENFALSEYILLDAREKQEYEISHLKNAQWIGYTSFRLNNVSHIPKTARLLVYCSVGYRSEKLVQQLRATGYANATNLVGGIFSWVNSGKQVFDSYGMETKRVHGFNRVWGIWVNRGQVIYD